MYYKYSCPVPKEQRPINEYSELIQSSFFSLPFEKEKIFQQKISKIFLVCFFCFFPFFNFFLSKNSSFFSVLMGTTLGVCFCVFLVLLRLFLAWKYIETRLYKPTIFYEESGWYDGRYWIKSKNILVQDRLIHAYQVVPSLKKLQNTLILVFCLFSCCFVGLFLS